MTRSSLRAIGILFWLSAAVAAFAAAKARQEETPPGHSSALSYLVRRVDHLEVTDASGRVQLNDPVFFRAADGSWSQVGRIDSASRNDPKQWMLAWYGTEVDVARCKLTSYRNSGQLDDVIATMFPPRKRQQIRDRLQRALEAHGDELMESLIPLVQQALLESMPVIEAEIRRSTDRHRDEIDKLLQRWNDELVDERLIPLARREIMPIIRTHGQPLADSIGRELWDRASLWRFGWRAAYDKSPLPRRDLLQQEWDRFVEDEAIPVFDQHMDEIVAAVQRAIADIAANRAVTNELGSVANAIASDPETLRLFRDILRESIVDNQKLHQVWQQVWSSERAQRVLDRAGDRLEPVVRQIGDDLFGSQDEGINPDFARVLRNQILGKDRRWIVATETDSSEETKSLVIRPSDRTMPYPVVYLADRSEEQGVKDQSVLKRGASP